MQGVISASYYEVLAAAVLKEAFVAGRCSGPLLCHGSCRIKPQQLALTINICEFVLTGFHRISVTVHIHPAGYLLTNNLEATDGRGRWTRASLSAQAANQVCRRCSESSLQATSRSWSQLCSSLLCCQNVFRALITLPVMQAIPTRLTAHTQ